MLFAPTCSLARAGRRGDLRCEIHAAPRPMGEETRRQTDDVQDRPLAPLKREMKRVRAPIAGEMSGHIFSRNAGTASTTHSIAARGFSKSSHAFPDANTPLKALPNALLYTGIELAIEGGRARMLSMAGLQANAKFEGAKKLSPSTACGWNIRMALAWPSLEHHAGDRDPLRSGQRSGLEAHPGRFPARAHGSEAGGGAAVLSETQLD